MGVVRYVKSPEEIDVLRRGAEIAEAVIDAMIESAHVGQDAAVVYARAMERMLEMGSDRIMYSVDYPFEDHAEASQWFDQCEISEADRKKIGRENACRLFGLK